MHLTGQQSVNKRDMKQLTIENFKYDCDDAAASKLSTVKDMNVQVYNEIGLSKEQFHATYPYFYDYGANQTPAFGYL